MKEGYRETGGCGLGKGRFFAVLRQEGRRYKIEEIPAGNLVMSEGDRLVGARTRTDGDLLMLF